MKSNLLMEFSTDKGNNKINVKKEFAAPLAKVWAAWTQSEILDQWWAPKPYAVKTKNMNFSEGGGWLYAMISPEGEAHWCRADYKKITPLKQYSALDAFCDENGSINTDFPRMLWQIQFSETENSTVVAIEISYDSLEDLEKITALGFKEGFTMALGNLDELFE